MDFSAVLGVVNSLSLDDRIRLVESVALSINAEQAKSELTDELKQELERRIADMDASPDDEIPWEQAKAEIQASLRR
ncbi:MAG: addiction module protein [Gemmataceae bacterium]|nr:addiction module protein [Gemmataceae bacterium]